MLLTEKMKNVGDWKALEAGRNVIRRISTEAGLDPNSYDRTADERIAWLKGLDKDAAEEIVKNIYLEKYNRLATLDRLFDDAVEKDPQEVISLLHRDDGWLDNLIAVVYLKATAEVLAAMRE